MLLDQMVMEKELNQQVIVAVELMVVQMNLLKEDWMADKDYQWY
jgi:hypothetical protein